VGYGSDTVSARGLLHHEGWKEPGEPEVKAQSAGGHFLSCSSLELRDTSGGLENQNKFTI